MSKPRPDVALANRERAIPPIKRFWTNVNKLGPRHPLHGTCWQWMGARDREYGKLQVGKSCVRAHRFSYSLLVGEIPTGMLVCHRCDNPLCVNPTHLFIGTDLDNSNDKVAKGRVSRLPGESNGRAVLTKDQVVEIRKGYRKSSRTQGAEALARLYGVSAFTILAAISGKTWKNV